MALASSCIDMLGRHRARQTERRLALGSAWRDEDLVFDRGDGGRLHVDSPGQALNRLAAAAGVPRIRLHDLRHAMRTVALAEGVHPKLVQERLGHASAKTTLDHYSHVSADLQRAAADQIEAALTAAAPGVRDQIVTKPPLAG